MKAQKKRNLLTPVAAAMYIGKSTDFLQKDRAKGDKKLIQYLRFGPRTIRYERETLDLFVVADLAAR